MRVVAKDDATKNLPADAPTQTTEKGLKIGVPTQGSFLGALKKIARRDSST